MRQLLSEFARAHSNFRTEKQEVTTQWHDSSTSYLESGEVTRFSSREGELRKGKTPIKEEERERGREKKRILGRVAYLDGGGE